MSQRISIQYSISLDELEEEVQRLLEKSFNKISNLSDVKISSRLSLGAIEDIDEVRQELASIDATLQDVIAIITGYVSYKTTGGISEKNNNSNKGVLKKDEQPSPPEYSF
tara:strand:+ start:251 stop:580 length:330 start_codon:yes stop_codon:yes gene_type:complete